MSSITFSSSQFGQDLTRVLTAAKSGPVIITTRGKATHVLLSIEEYQRLTRQQRCIADAIAMPSEADVEFNAPRVTIGSHPADLS